MRLVAVCQLLVLIAIGSLQSASGGHEATAEQIVESVLGTLGDIRDYSADFEVDTDVVESQDMATGSWQWRAVPNGRMFKIVEGSPYDRVHVTDGSGSWNVFVPDRDWDYIYFPATANYLQQLTDSRGYGLFHVEDLLRMATWDLAPGQEKVNGVICCRLHATQGRDECNVWIDAATAQRVIRVIRTLARGTLRLQIDYGHYRTIDGLACVPSTIRVRRFRKGCQQGDLRYTFYDIELNRGLDASIFTVSTPPGYREGDIPAHE